MSKSKSTDFLKQFEKMGLLNIMDERLMLKGLAVKHLALVYLLGTNIIPFSKILFLAGQTQSCKSAFSLYLIREFIQAGGYGFYIENENKFSTKFISNVVGQENASRILLRPVSSVNEWQTVLSEILDSIEQYNPTEPILIVVDSLVGTPSAESKKIIAKEGYNPERGTDALATARSITGYMRFLTSRLCNKNITVLFTNHMKPPISVDGRPVSQYEKSTPGGGSQDFHAVLYLCSYKHADLVKDSIAIGRTITYRLYKSSMSSTGRKISVDFMWNQVPYEFLWDKAFIQLAFHDATLNKILRLEKISKGRYGLRYKSEPLNLTEATESEVEQAVWQNDEIRKQIFDYWQIQEFLVV